MFLSLLSQASFSLFAGAIKWSIFQRAFYFPDSPWMGVAAVQSLGVSHHPATCTVRGFTPVSLSFPSEWVAGYCDHGRYTRPGPVPWPPVGARFLGVYLGESSLASVVTQILNFMSPVFSKVAAD